MSIEIVREVNRRFPEYLQRNVGESCHLFTVKLIEHLRAGNRLAFHVAKSPGEGQYVPEGFRPRDVIGLDGKTYTCTGVSHDAIWCDGNQFDAIASANDSDYPIYTDSGAQIVGQPVWNAVDPKWWRPNNPPLKGEPVISPPPKPTAAQYPGDTWFVEKVGVPLEADYALAGQRLNAGSATWFARTIFDAIEGAMTMDASVAKHRNEWRAVLGLPPL